MEYIKLKGLNVFEKIKMFFTGEVEKNYYNDQDKLIVEKYDRSGIKTLEIHESFRDEKGIDFSKRYERKYENNSIKEDVTVIERIIPEKGSDKYGVIIDKIETTRRYDKGEYQGYIKEISFKDADVRIKSTDVNLGGKNYFIENTKKLNIENSNAKYTKIEYKGNLKHEKHQERNILSKKEIILTDNIQKNILEVESIKETKAVKNFETNEKELVTIVKDKNENIVGIEHNNRNLKVENLNDGKIKVTEKMDNGHTRVEIYPENHKFIDGFVGTRVDIMEYDAKGNLILNEKGEYKVNFLEDAFLKVDDKRSIKDVLEKIDQEIKEFKETADEIKEIIDSDESNEEKEIENSNEYENSESIEYNYAKWEVTEDEENEFVDSTDSDEH